jgi:hypothetical protein
MPNHALHLTAAAAGSFGVQALCAAAGGRLSRADLIRESLADKLGAIAGYNDVLWKVRVGYAAVLYGTLSLALSREAARVPPADRWAALSVAALVVGFSAAAGVIDAGFQVKKLKVVVTRDALVRVALAEAGPADPAGLEMLCLIAGEMPLRELSGGMRGEFGTRVRSYVGWVLLPLYAPAPLVAAATCAVVWAAR